MNNSVSVLYLSILVLIVLFWGKPDLHDRLVGNCVLEVQDDH